MSTDLSSAPPALAIEGLTVAYAAAPVLRDVHLIVPQGAMLAIIGPNGAGKSTLIKAAIGLVPRLSGAVHFGGDSFAQAQPRIAYVPQRASVDWEFPATALDVVLMGFYRELGLWRRTSARHRARALACLARVGMEDFAARQIGQLSGGQQQRVFLARALAQEARLYILDEPFAGVDAATERAIIDVLKDLNAAGATIVAVHHDLATVRSYFSHVALVNGTCLAQGPVATTFTAAALQRTYGGRLSPAQMAATSDAVAPDLGPADAAIPVPVGAGAGPATAAPLDGDAGAAMTDGRG